MGRKFLVGVGVALIVLKFGITVHAAPPADPCSLLTTAQVSAALGVTASDGKSIATSLCQWSAPGKNGGSQKVALTIGNAQRFAMAKTPVNSPAITKTPVSGVGDEAVFGTTAGQAASINVKKGNVYFAISLMGVPMDRAQAVVVALAKNALTKM